MPPKSLQDLSEEHKYPRQVSAGIITRAHVTTRNEGIVRMYVTDVLEPSSRKEETRKRVGGGYTAAKLQCPATHNAATKLATVIMLVLTARLRSRR